MQTPTPPQNPEDVVRSIWKAGIQAVESERLVQHQLRLTPGELCIAGKSVQLQDFDRLIIVGGGKAGAGMVAGMQPTLESLADLGKEITGWVNVPADCVTDNRWVTLHPGRPAGFNAPTSTGMMGARKILDWVNHANDRDLVICLLSGGGSALLPLPIDRVTIEVKANLTQWLGAQGATIDELNQIRQALSQIKGGGLVRKFSGLSFHSLIISDVMSNSLETIASGPTVACNTDVDQAIDLLRKFDSNGNKVDSIVYEAMRSFSETGKRMSGDTRLINNTIIGDASTAVHAAATFAQKYSNEVVTHVTSTSGPDIETVADQIWLTISNQIRRSTRQGKTSPRSPGLWCSIAGCEPSIQLHSSHPGKGGRNQHLALLILDRLRKSDLERQQQRRFMFLSGGTDGEDGPTDATGAIASCQQLDIARQKQLSISEHVLKNDAYHFFQKTGGLFKTGPTHTNVGDLQVTLIS